MKLISMTDFVLEQGNPSNTDSQFADKVMAYANFLKQPLLLSMFVTQDERKCWEVGCGVGTGQRKCNRENCDNTWRMDTKIPICKNQKINTVLFEGFMISDSYIENANHTIFLENSQGDFIGHKHNWEESWDLYGVTIEGLINLTDNAIELTDSAIKQIGL